MTPGPAAQLLHMMDRNIYRPAHIHLMVRLSLLFPTFYSSPQSPMLTIIKATHPDYKPLTTQIFDSKDPYLTNDSVFAVKDSLVVDFVPRKDDPQASLELCYDVKLAPAEKKSDGA